MFCFPFAPNHCSCGMYEAVTVVSILMGFKMCLEVWGISYFFYLYFFNSCWNALLFIFKQNLAAGMNKIKEHHNLERQIEDWQIGLAEGAFSRGMGQQGFWEQSSPFPSLSLCVLPFPIISPAPHLSPQREVCIKAGVSAASKKVRLVQLDNPSSPLAARSLSRAWRSCSFCFPVEYLMRIQFLHYNAL